MDTGVILLLMFASVLFGIIVLGAHLGFLMGFVAIVFGLISFGPACFNMFIYRSWSLMSNYLMIAVPMFIFMGYVLEKGGFAEDLYGGAEVLFGRLRGGLATATIVISTALAMCTGIVAASICTAGVLALPSMLKRRYDKSLTAGTIAAGGTLGILIPPSIMLVVYAASAGISLGKLFLGAFPAGFLLSALYVGYINALVAIRPGMAPTGAALPQEKTSAVRRRYLRGLRGILPMGLLIVAVLGTIMFGIATPTEASGTGAFMAIVIAALYRRASWKNLKEATLRTFEMMGMIGAIIIGAMAFSTVFITLGGAEIVDDLLTGANLSSLATLLIMMFTIFILGMFVDWIPILLICLPVFLPIAKTMGWDPIWFAILICVDLQTSWLTPPFGYAIFYLQGMAPDEVTYGDIIRGCYPFVALQLVGLALLIAFPQIVVFLPNLVFD